MTIQEKLLEKTTTNSQQIIFPALTSLKSTPVQSSEVVATKVQQQAETGDKNKEVPSEVVQNQQV